MSRSPHFSRFMAGIVSVIFLLFFLFSSSTTFAAPLATTIVSPATPNGWSWALESGSNGSIAFVPGPAGQPAGNGSARFQTGNSATGVILARAGAYPGLRFDDITTLTYDLYKAAGSSSTNDVIFQFNVDYNLTDANTSWQGRLVYEPYYISSVPNGAWTSINPLTDGAGWWATGAPGNSICPISNPCTWAEVLTAFPNAGVQTGSLAAINLKAGSGWTTPFDGNVDNLHLIADGGIDDTYDFENDVAAPGPACTTTCYVSTLGSDSNGGASAGDPLRNIQTGITNVSVGGTVVVAPGTYYESLTVGKWLILDGAGSGTNPAVDTVVIATNSTIDVLTLNTGGSSALNRTVIRDLHFTRASSPVATDVGDGVFINAGSFLTFDNIASTLHPSNGFNFGAGPVNDLQILNSTLSNNFGNGWRSASGTVLDGFLFENSNVANNRSFGLITGGGSNSSTHNNITLRNNTFTANSHTAPTVGSGDVSFFLYNGNLTIEDVTINGVAGPSVGPHIGFQLRGANTPAPSGTVSIDGLTITGNYIRPGGTPGNSFRLTNYGSGSSFSINDLDVDSGTNSVGVLLSGLSDTIDLGNATLDGQAVIAIEGSAQNNTGASNTTATDITVNGVEADTASLAQLFAIEDVIYHRIDVGTPVNTNQAIGLVRVVANNVYITANSFLAPVTTTPRIQRGVDAASAGDTVNVGAGTFNEAVIINKSLTLDGVGAGTNPTLHTILDGGVPASPSGNGITLNTGITNVTIQDLRVQGFGGSAPGGSGIFGTAGNNDTTIQRTELYNNNLSAAANGGGVYMNGPVNNVTIDDNDVVNNRSRGIVIWNGFKTNIRITNNLVANNNCCGIELQDGTASGVTVTGNTVTNNSDSGIGLIGLTDGAGANLIANNTVSGTGRFGIEIKLPDGTGLDTGDGSIVVEDNTVTLSGAPANNRDLAGISVYRRGWVAGNNNVDIPTGVIVRDNEVNGFQQPSASDGFGIVVEGVNHQVTNNDLNNNDVGVQGQGGHLPYTPNSNVDGNQDIQGDQFFGRGNSPIGCPINISGNTFAGNSTDTRTVGTGGFIRATNLNTSETFCTIQAAIDDANTINGHVIEIEPGVHNEAVLITKSITLQGAGAGTTPWDTVLDGNSPITLSGNGITIATGVANVTIQDLRVQDFGSTPAGGSGVKGAQTNNVTIQRVHAYTNNTGSADLSGNGGIYLSGPISNVEIDDSHSVGNQGRGIVIWDGVKQNIAITNNLVTNNNCCGIELQDGTASGVTITGNTVSNNTDSGIGLIGLTDGAGANLIANNTVSGTGRFGIEIKLPDGSGTDIGDGSIVVQNNTVTLSGVPVDVRDLAGISVYRRGYTAANVDIPTGVIVRNNTVNDYQQPSTSDGFGIVVEGVNHVVTNNTLNDNDVGVQAQGGHLPYTPNSGPDGDQSNLNDQFFGRGNSPIGCPVTISSNTYTGNSTDTRFVGYANNGYRATNVDTNEQFCTIQAAIDDANTIDGHTIEVVAGTHVEQLVINKAITLEGAQAGVVAKDRVGAQTILRWSGNTTPITLSHDDITIDGFVLNAEGAATPWIINTLNEAENGVYENIQILNNEFIGNAGPHPIDNNPGGMYFLTSANTLIEGNYFNDLGNHAVFMANTSNGTTYRNNDSYRNYNSNFSVHTGPHTNVTIENNRAIEDSMILFNMDGGVIQNNVFTATAATNARIYLGGGSSSVTVDDNDFNGVRSAAIISFDPGFGYGGNTNMTITDNTITATVSTLVITNVGLIDLRDTSGTNLVTGNTITVPSGTLAVDSVRGISVQSGMGTTTIAANTINGNNVDTSPATPSIGIFLQSNLSATSNTTIRNNVISGWNSGVEGGTLAAGVTATVYENNLAGNAPNAVANGAGIVLNASANWYGTNTPVGVDALVTTNADYTPWFNVGTDTSGTAGWQGDFSWFNADDNSPQVGTTGRINEAIGLVTTGGTVNLAAGTYNETATVPKSLTLQGAGATTILDGNTPSVQTGNGITLNGGVTNVTIQDLRVQDYGFTGLGSGIFGTVGNDNTTIQRTELYNNNTSNLGNGGGVYMNGPVSNVTIDDNDVVGNRSRGIVIWNGLKSNITITNNYVASNNCCGIELQDGTATGVTATGNIVENNSDSGMAFIGLTGPGENLIANNTISGTGRFGLEIKLPDGSGADTGAGRIVVEDNTITLSGAPVDARDVAGISVYRRGYVVGNGNVDIPVGVIVRDNTVNGYQQPSTSEGFGIVVEGLNHQVTNNILNNNNVGVQVQGGHLPYTPNTNIDGDQSNLNDQFFGRGNAPIGCATVSGNTFSGNTTDTRSVGNGGAGIRATNTTTMETFCTIQAAIDDAQTLNGHTIEVAAGTWEEQVEVNKAITLEGQGEGVTTIVAPLDMPDFFNSGADNNYPIIYVHDVNATIRDLTVDGDGRGNLNYRFMGVAFEQAGGTLEDVTITGMTETPFNGNQHGNGIWGRANNGTTRTLTVTNVTITDFQKNATVFTGANLTVSMDDSTVVGSGVLGLGLPAQNGIQLSGGAFGSFDNNAISDIVYAPATFAAAGYLISGAGGTVDITNSTITDTTTAIYYINSVGDITDNTIVNTPAGMGSAVYWWGAIVYNTTAAPFASDEKAALPELFDAGDSSQEDEAASALLNRSYTIEGNTFIGGGGGDGLSIYADAPEVATVTINENTVEDWATGLYLDGAGTLNATVTANSITDSDVGIQSERGTVSITNNVLDANGTGILVSGAGTIAPTIYQNSIVSTGLGVNKTAAGIALVNASANWWGTNTASGVAAELSAGVDYTPWFNVGTDTDGGTAGWQGDFSWLNADDSSPQVGAIGRINEAIGLVTTSGTVNLAAGTYNETTSIPKSLTLQGAGAGTNPATHTILEGFAPVDTVGNGITIAAGVTNVTVQTLRIQNFDLDGGFVAGIYGSGDNSNITVSGVHLYGNNRNAPFTSQGGGIHFANGTNGPSDITITASEAVTNTGRGITLWIGAREDVTITNNLVNDNSIVGIDLSGGTSEGVVISGNTVTENGDSGIAVSGLQAGDGASRIATNTVTNNGRFGIEVKMPNGNGTDTGDGSIVIEGNIVSLTAPIVATEQRDLAGIAVFRRDYVTGNADIPTGVIVRNNTVSGYQQSTVSEGFGIVVEGVNHQVTTNTLNNNEVGVQVQGGHTPYVPNTGTNGLQDNLPDQFFGRGNAPYGCAAVSGNIFSGNTTNTRSVGNGGAGIRATNLNTSETFCTIQAAIDDAQTLNGHTIDIEPGTHVEQVELYKELTLQGDGEGSTIIQAPSTLSSDIVAGYTNFAVLYVRDVTTATITGLTIDFNFNAEAYSVGYPEGALIKDAEVAFNQVSILNVISTNPANYGLQLGEGVYACNDTTDRTVTFDDVTVNNFQKNALTLDCDNLNAIVTNSSFTGLGNSNIIAQNGVQLGGGATGTITDNTFSAISYTPSTFFGSGVLLFDNGASVLVEDNTFTNTQAGVYVFDTEATVLSNTITYNAMGGTVDYAGVIIESATAAPFAPSAQRMQPAREVAPRSERSLLLARTSTVNENVMMGTGIGRGVWLNADAPESTSVQIFRNSITGFGSGVVIDGVATLTTTVSENFITNNGYGVRYYNGNTTIYQNSITGSTTLAVEHANFPTVSTIPNASANWYGINTPAGVDALVSANVDYTPWFNVGTDTNVGTAGWQGDFSWFNADDDSPQTGVVGRINEAITLVTVGGTVNLAAGNYNEGATVPKSLTLQGAGATTILDGNTPSATTGNGITLNSGVTNVTIQDLRVQDYGGTGLGSGIFGTVSNNNTIVRRTELYNNNLSNLGNGGGLYMNGPVSNVTIDDNDVVNNRSRGIVIWNGLKTNITITNNYVANNICCGIELQDGTASGITVTGNIVENNGDSGMAFIGLQGGSGANLIANNTITNNGRFGIEIKLPNGNGGTSGDGSIVVENNTVSRNVPIPGAELRDTAGISVYRRGYVIGNGNVDIPAGVVVRNNTVSGYAQPSTSDGFGIVVEGVSHQVLNNILNNNDVGVQVQGGHLPYTPNTAVDGDQNNLNDQFFGRGNAPVGCAISTGNIFSGNTTNTRSVGNAGDSIRATNTNTSEQFCTIQSAIDDADTVNTHTIAIAAGTWEEQLEVPKSITLQGASQATTIIRSPVTLTKFFVTSANNYPVIYIHDTANVTVADLTVDGAGRGNGNARFIGIGYRNAGGAVNNVTVQDVRETPISGNQSGIGIYAFADNGTARTLSVNNATVFGFQKNGTAFNGANLTATMSNSTVTGAGPINFNAQNGIQLAFGANGSFTNNTISNVGYTPTTDNASGYLLYQAAGTTSITNSDLEDVEVGAYAYDSALTFNGNVITQTTAGMTGMPTWFGVFIASDVAAPLVPNATVQPVEDGVAGVSANAMMNRAHILNGNTMTSEGRVGTAIGTDVDALEVTSLNIITNTLSTWDVGIEFDGDGLLAASVDDSYLYDNAVGVVIRTGVISVLNGAITEGGVGVRYFDSDGVSPEIHGNDIDYNESWGVEHATFNTQFPPTIVDATSNYWGDISGPEDNHLPGDAPCTTLMEYNPTSTGNPVTECVQWGPPLEVTLANFEAIARSSDILVTWETASETDNLGFNLYRATTPDGTPEQLNGELIPSQVPGGGGGAIYEWEDTDVTEGTTYFYWLEAVDIQGNGSPYFGPVSATFGAPTAVTLSNMNVQPATLPILLAAGLVLFGAVGMVMVRRNR
jgi:hypothetical protein